jgi:hypothetical protein
VQPDPQDDGFAADGIDGRPEDPAGDKDRIHIGQQRFDGLARPFQIPGGSLKIAVINGHKETFALGHQLA